MAYTLIVISIFKFSHFFEFCNNFWIDMCKMLFFSHLHRILFSQIAVQNWILHDVCNSFTFLAFGYGNCSITYSISALILASSCCCRQIVFCIACCFWGDIACTFKARTTAHCSYFFVVVLRVNIAHTLRKS